MTHDSIELLQSGLITELPSQTPAYPFLAKEKLQALFAGFELLFEAGHLDFKPRQTLNDLFPDLRVASAKEILEAGWKA